MKLSPTQRHLLQALVMRGEIRWQDLPKSPNGATISCRTWRPMIREGLIAQAWIQGGAAGTYYFGATELGRKAVQS
jgi:hypothetical protein